MNPGSCVGDALGGAELPPVGVETAGDALGNEEGTAEAVAGG